MSKEQFSLLPNWKQVNDKKSIGLFNSSCCVACSHFVCIAKLKKMFICPILILLLIIVMLTSIAIFTNLLIHF